MHKDSAHIVQQTHSASFIKTDQLMLYREIIASCSESHKIYSSTFFRRNIEFFES